MRKSLLVFLALVAAALLMASCKKGEQQSSASDKAPDFTLTDVNGQAYSLSALRGKVVLMDFWATWCPPCRMSVPELNKVYEAFKGKDFVLIAISADDYGPGLVSKLKAFGKKHGVEYPMLPDSMGVADMYHVDGLPQSFLINKDGFIVDRHMGYYPDMASSYETEINQLLGK